jgi:YVTN family beta-propeller protein
MNRPTRSLRAVLSLCAAALLSACEEDPQKNPQTGLLREALFVAHEGRLVSYDIETGQERPGTVEDVTSPVDPQVLEDGTLLVHLTTKNQVLIVDGLTMLERARLPSSSLGATRPVHSYVSPVRNGKRYWLTLNDGDGKPETNSALFVDVTRGSDTYLEPVGEVSLGNGHHKASFSNTRERVVISNIADCEDALSVYDYSDVGNVRRVLKVSAADLGWGPSRPCAANYNGGFPPAPHGCATSTVSGKAYCNLTSTGELVAVDLDADVPTFEVLRTSGTGGGYTKAHPNGRYLYSLQESPREGQASGVRCQLGQLVVIDASTSTVVREVPLLYRGPGCELELAGTAAAKAGPGHIVLGKDGKTLYITPAGAFRDNTSRVSQELVVDISDPAAPVQRASIPVGLSTGHHGDVLTANGRFLFVTNTEDDTVSQIDTVTNTVVRTLNVKDIPLALVTFGTNEGASALNGPLP